MNRCDTGKKNDVTCMSGKLSLPLVATGTDSGATARNLSRRENYLLNPRVRAILFDVRAHYCCCRCFVKLHVYCFTGPNYSYIPTALIVTRAQIFFVLFKVLCHFVIKMRERQREDLVLPDVIPFKSPRLSIGRDARQE